MDPGLDAWRHVALTHDYRSFVKCPCGVDQCQNVALHLPPPTESCLDKLIGLFTDKPPPFPPPVPPVPHGMHAHTHIDVNTGADGVRVVATNGPLVVGGGISNGKAYVDPKMGKKRAKQERKDAVAEAKAREHHFKEEIDLTTAAHKEARKAAIKFEKAREKEAMKERKLKEKEERERERMMLKMQKDYMAWAKKHGQHGHPHAHAPPHAHLVQNGFFAVPRPMDYGVRRDPFMDQYANHWPLMSNTMMHAVREQNRTDMLVGVVNGQIHCG